MKREEQFHSAPIQLFNNNQIIPFGAFSSSNHSLGRDFFFLRSDWRRKKKDSRRRKCERKTKEKGEKNAVQDSRSRGKNVKKQKKSKKKKINK